MQNMKEERGKNIDLLEWFWTQWLPVLKYT